MEATQATSFRRRKDPDTTSSSSSSSAFVAPPILSSPSFQQTKRALPLDFHAFNFYELAEAKRRAQSTQSYPVIPDPIPPPKKSQPPSIPVMPPLAVAITSIASVSPAASSKIAATVTSVVHPTPSVPSKPTAPAKPTLPPPPAHELKLAAASKNSLWAEKHRPQSLKDFYGNPKSVERLTNWVKQRKARPGTKGKVKVVAVLSGPPGVGKTTIANLALKQFGYQVAEVNASDERTKDAVYHNIKETVTRKSLGKPSAILLDEIDGSVSQVGDGEGDNTGIAGVIKFLDECKKGQWPAAHPIICVCNDGSSKAIRALMARSETIKFYPPFESVMRQVLLRLCQKEKIRMAPSQQDKVIEASRGDVRRMCQLLQMMNVHPGGNFDMDQFLEHSQGDEFDDMFSSARKLVYDRNLTLEEATNLVATDSALSTLMMQENMPTLFGMRKNPTAQDMDEVSRYCDALSLTDVIDTQQWQERGFNSTGSTLLAQATRVHGAGFRSGIKDQPIKFTQFFEKQSAGKQEHARNTLAAKALHVHPDEMSMVTAMWDRLSPEDRDLSGMSEEMQDAITECVRLSSQKRAKKK